MDMIRDDPANHWPESDIATLFLSALEHLMLKLDQGKIDFFFDSMANNLRGKLLEPIVQENMVQFLKRSISKLKTSQNTENCRKVWMKTILNDSF